ncbi:MAG: hypothetical protein UT59_C0054G0001, partial [candidate division CPR2 bacterium GW2011_GWD1_39_7]
IAQTEPKKSKKIIIYIILGVLLTAGIASGATYYLVAGKKDNKEVAKTDDLSKVTPKPSTTPSVTPKPADTIEYIKSNNHYWALEYGVGNVHINLYDKKGNKLKEYEPVESLDNTQPVNDNLYAFSYSEKSVLKYTSDGKVTKITLPNVEVSSNFKVFPDETKIAWVNLNIGANGGPINSSLGIYDMSGKEISVLTKQTKQDGAFKVYGVSENSKYVYYKEELWGKGGYILFGNVYTEPLKKIDIDSKKITALTSVSEEGFDRFGQNDNEFFFVNNKTDEVVCRDDNGAVKFSIKAPKFWENQGQGHITSDGTYIYYSVAKNNPEAEESKIIKQDIKTGKYEILSESSEKGYAGLIFADGFYDAETLLVESSLNVSTTLTLLNIADKTKSQLMKLSGYYINK